MCILGHLVFLMFPHHFCVLLNLMFNPSLWTHWKPLYIWLPTRWLFQDDSILTGQRALRWPLFSVLASHVLVMPFSSLFESSQLLTPCTLWAQLFLPVWLGNSAFLLEWWCFLGTGFLGFTSAMDPLATAIYTQTCLLQSWGVVPLLSSYQHICPSGKLGSMCLSEMSLKIFFMAGYRAIYSSMDTSAYCSCRGPKFTHFGWLMATCTNTYRFDSLFGPHKYL